MMESRHLFIEKFDKVQCLCDSSVSDVKYRYLTIYYSIFERCLPMLTEHEGLLEE